MSCGNSKIAWMVVERIPIEKIGLYEDEFRASWPVEHDVRAEGDKSILR